MTAVYLLVLLALVVSLGACRSEDEAGTETPIGEATEMVETQAPITPTPAATEGPLAVNYTYDDAGRLIRAEYSNGAAITYTYDDAGNLLQREITTNP